MLNTLIIIGVVLWIATMITNGITLYSVLIVIPTIMFAIRKLAINMKLGSFLTCEIMFFFFSCVWKLLFGGFEAVRVIITIVIRIIFILIVMYDEKCFVYIQEERKRE